MGSPSETNASGGFKLRWKINNQKTRMKESKVISALKLGFLWPRAAKAEVMDSGKNTECDKMECEKSQHSESECREPVAPKACIGEPSFDYTSSKKICSPSTITENDLTVLGLIGCGDLGKVYLTQDKYTKKLYATKVISKRTALHRNKIERIITEQSILLSLSHPFLAKLYHCFQNHNNVYFVMEYCAGGELFRRLQSLQNKSLSEEHTKFFTAEVVCAIEYLHLMGLIYRDLKPENILLNERGHIVLSDFDLSRGTIGNSKPPLPRLVKSSSVNFLGKSHSSLKLDTKLCTKNIQARSFVGTEEYIAPEVIVSKSHTSVVDWWTLGIFLYELLHGYSPFKGENKNETFNNIVHQEVKIRVRVSKNCTNIIKQLLRKNPKKRLGAHTGASEVKAHPFFKGVVWDLLRNCDPPDIWNLSASNIPVSTGEEFSGISKERQPFRSNSDTGDWSSSKTAKRNIEKMGKTPLSRNYPNSATPEVPKEKKLLFTSLKSATVTYRV